MLKLSIILGILIAIVPLSGFPQDWKDIFFHAAGSFVALLVFLHLKEEMLTRLQGTKDPAYIENSPLEHEENVHDSVYEHDLNEDNDGEHNERKS